MPRSSAAKKRVVGDEFFLPPRVLKARREDPDHWAGSADGTGYLPPTQDAVPRLDPLPVPAVAVASIPQHRCHGGLLHVQPSWRSVQDDAGGVAPETLVKFGIMDYSSGNWTPGAPAESLDAFVLDADDTGEVLRLRPEDEPEELEMLSPEESAAKSAIWDEVNKELIEYLHLRMVKAKARATPKAAGSARVPGNAALFVGEGLPTSTAASSDPPARRWRRRKAEDLEAALSSAASQAARTFGIPIPRSAADAGSPGAGSFGNKPSRREGDGGAKLGRGKSAVAADTDEAIVGEDAASVSLAALEAEFAETQALVAARAAAADDLRVEREKAEIIERRRMIASQFDLMCD